MHEDTIATIREEEGYGLVLAVCLWSLWVCHAKVHLLPHLVERRKRLATAIDALAWSQREDGIDAA